jgi:hypothetical protein
MRIHAVTFNPVIDQTVMLDHLVPGEVHRAHTVRQNAGGKGINVASCLADWGMAVTAHGLLGADNTAPFDMLFAAKPIDDRFIRIAGSTGAISGSSMPQGPPTSISMVWRWIWAASTWSSRRFARLPRPGIWWFCRAACRRDVLMTSMPS